MKIVKPILAWTIEDLDLLRDDPYNLEDMNIEYKEQYNKDPDELRKDIISFANSKIGGYILFGIRDDPFELVGISRKEVDNLKVVIGSVINSKIDPHLSPLPSMNPIYISNDLYILGIQIFPKEKGLYGIRVSDSPNKPNFRSYSFWIRSDGRKRQLSMEEVNSYIIETDPFKKKLEVTIKIDYFPETPTYNYYDRLSPQEIRNLNNSHPIIGDMPKYLIIKGVNKSPRPIIIQGRSIFLYNKKENEWIGIFPRYKFDPVTIFNTPIDTEIKLKDTESCAWHYPLTEIEEFVKELHLESPIRIKGSINTDDEEFYSEEIDLKL